jgi:hypothetical protein
MSIEKDAMWWWANLPESLQKNWIVLMYKIWRGSEKNVKAI